MEKKALLSSLWIFVLINMIYADILSLMDPVSHIRLIMAGKDIPPGGLIVGAFLMESAILMTFLPRILKPTLNKIITTLVVLLNTLAVIKGGSGDYYIFFATVEVITMIAIVILTYVN
ncbi:DUF6326 family protein [Spirochaeta cellobiosiphila]|uniref:DUF6326 family protein n=1 Tax=Spirochaeta cellobiosiphila TaxID=504483 RepID=UPI00042A7DEE|nr:DUF6326 family protein [Spirochaeta cellobiosiphila]